ncbi:hypothetical protein [Nocardia spumae]|uniref:hypothetical protein n=1 Tax=Nocardia spumae TaxID=2887190 RepID=UPI001D1419EC|nr:hypothetical protein [Nocardia spumae]
MGNPYPGVPQAPQPMPGWAPQPGTQWGPPARPAGAVHRSPLDVVGGIALIVAAVGTSVRACWDASVVGSIPLLLCAIVAVVGAILVMVKGAASSTARMIALFGGGALSLSTVGTLWGVVHWDGFGYLVDHEIWLTVLPIPVLVAVVVLFLPVRTGTTHPAAAAPWSAPAYPPGPGTQWLPPQTVAPQSGYPQYGYAPQPVAPYAAPFQPGAYPAPAGVAPQPAVPLAVAPQPAAAPPPYAPPPEQVADPAAQPTQAVAPPPAQVPTPTPEESTPPS